MYDPVLADLSTEFLRIDYHVILFNMRGVGSSAGRSSFTGIPESQDMQKVVSWATEEIANLDTVVLLGYSYGSLITSLCPSPTRLFPDKIVRSSHILLSHPLGPIHFLTFFHASKYADALEKLLHDPMANVLVLHGGRDQFTGSKRYENWVAQCRHIRELRVLRRDGGNPPRRKSFASDSTERPAIASSVGSSKTLQPSSANAGGTGMLESIAGYQAIFIPRGDHFWRGDGGKEMRRSVMSWVRRLDAGEFDRPAA